jgi:hypothetical protein
VNWLVQTAFQNPTSPHPFFDPAAKSGYSNTNAKPPAMASEAKSVALPAQAALVDEGFADPVADGLEPDDADPDEAALNTPPPICDPA